MPVAGGGQRVVSACICTSIDTRRCVLETDRGLSETSRELVQITAGGGLRIEAGAGVVVEYTATGDLDAGIAQLGQSPGLAWMETLRARDDVDWTRVETAFEDWDCQTQGLTEAGALLVTLVASYALGPGIDAHAANFGGACPAMTAAFDAGLTSLSEAGVQETRGSSGCVRITSGAWT